MLSSFDYFRKSDFQPRLTWREVLARGSRPSFVITSFLALVEQPSHVHFFIFTYLSSFLHIKYNKHLEKIWVLIQTPILVTWFKELTHWKRPWCWERQKQEEKGTTEDETVGWHQQLDEPECEQTLEDGDEQGNLACCSPWGCNESDMTERLNKNNIQD